jgi:alpha-tubulin suppressor-like RCC1 family protein
MNLLRICTLVGLTVVVITPVQGQSYVNGWGLKVFDSRNNELPFVQVSAGAGHTIARRSNGTLVIWGGNDKGSCVPPVLPAGLTYVDIAGGDGYTVARRSDGSVVAWGSNSYGQCNVLPLPGGVTYAGVAAGNNHSVAFRSDGVVVGWGLTRIIHEGIS